MKRAGILICVVLLFRIIVSGQTGADFASAIPLTLDGVLRTYSTSSSMGTAITCTSFTGSSPITFFSFTTNSVPDKVLVVLSSPSGPCEVLLYSSSGVTMYSSSSMCFDDGTGLWSFSQSFSFAANTTYKLRIKTAGAGTITLAAKYYTPPNNNCIGATGIGPNPIQDNNACNVAGTGVLASNLCASTLENTAFYKYTVENTGVSIININNINCDNGASNNNNGFQIGFFTGNCFSLTPLSCTTGSGAFVSATTVSLPAGTDVFVAIDGVSGANCQYEINAINAVILAADIENFSGWKKEKSNLLKWKTLNEEENSYYEIQKSPDRLEFITIGRVDGKKILFGESAYEFEDNNPGLISYYRLKHIEVGTRPSYSKIIELRRENPNAAKVEMNNPVKSFLNMRVTTANAGDFGLTIINTMGQTVFNDRVKFSKGINPYTKSLSFLPAGNYYLLLNGDETRSITSFIKLN